MDAPIAGETLVFEDWRLDRQMRLLYRRDATGEWTPVPLGSRAHDILALLLELPGALASKDVIMGAVWPNTAVEPNNLNVQIAALRRVLDEGRSGDSCIQTIPGWGYRFLLPVSRVEESQLDPPAPTADTGVLIEPPTRSHRLRPRGLAVGSGLVATFVLLMAAMWHGGWLARPPVPPRLSIVVLPFENLSDARSEDYLADGITEDVTTDLSRVPGMFVIARESAYTYRGKAVDVRKVGEELGVRYVVEGSVRKLGNELRVNAQLIATETGAHLWADRFDQQLKDLSAGQDAIVRRIGQTLDVALADVEAARSKRERPTNPDAFDLIQRARALGLHPMGPQEHAERMALLDRALQLDPASIPAMTQLAIELILDVYNFRNYTGGGLERADRLVTDAAAINPDHLSVLASTFAVTWPGTI